MHSVISVKISVTEVGAKESRLEGVVVSGVWAWEGEQIEI